uniref:Uncharacterized protein n=1 Tax=Arundo donax TaxID=35708 RepID=A0A0A8YWF7_ARUDO
MAHYFKFIYVKVKEMVRFKALFPSEN